ncbi:CHY zinc finger protein [Virgibacillus alimentarius]|uniref:CHY-type Zn-finger protein n=1 Tax=Virgibacillus alimentarius TaxID=698769 RepID=A0ABS4S8N8_9BACI|nr:MULTISPECIES: CHY zinc finger protein [Virgibacillus]MBP2257861.1 putative CHY-type Zn-finger protein [Virgibacillus alimentarius]HLR66585.1 CHY zinc finger protein [Virgibacillus sp.]
MKIDQFIVHGAIDEKTRCEHYQTKKDIIAIKFFCCDAYFPCYLCHQKYGCGKGAVWPKKEFGKKAVLCGSCKNELTIQAYRDCRNTCPYCEAQFNSGCLLHHHLYFEKDT